MEPEPTKKAAPELNEAELEEAGGRRTEWTDHDIHDPGVTLRRDLTRHRTRPFEPDA